MGRCQAGRRRNAIGAPPSGRVPVCCGEMGWIRQPSEGRGSAAASGRGNRAEVSGRSGRRRGWQRPGAGRGRDACVRLRLAGCGSGSARGVDRRRSGEGGEAREGAFRRDRSREKANFQKNRARLAATAGPVRRRNGFGGVFGRAADRLPGAWKMVAGRRTAAQRGARGRAIGPFLGETGQSVGRRARGSGGGQRLRASFWERLHGRAYGWARWFERGRVRVARGSRRSQERAKPAQLGARTAKMVANRGDMADFWRSEWSRKAAGAGMGGGAARWWPRGRVGKPFLKPAASGRRGRPEL